MTTYTPEQVAKENLKGILALIDNTMADTTWDLFNDEPRTIEERREQALAAVRNHVEFLLRKDATE